MVTYNFFCTNCDKEVVVRQSIHADLPTTCPVCSSIEFKQRFPDVKSKTLTGHGILERCENLASQDIKKLLKGDDRALSDLVGEKPKK